MDDTLPPAPPYRLAALLRRDEWEGQVLAAEAERARRIADERHAAHAQTLQRIAQAQAESRELCRPEARISLDRNAVLRLFIHQQHAVSQEQQQVAQRAEALYRQIAAQLETLRRSVKLIERHRERLLQQQATEGQRRVQRVADDGWLQRHGRD